MLALTPLLIIELSSVSVKNWSLLSCRRNGDLACIICAGDNGDVSSRLSTLVPSIATKVCIFCCYVYQDITRSALLCLSWLPC